MLYKCLKITKIWLIGLFNNKKSILEIFLNFSSKNGIAHACGIKLLYFKKQ